MTHNHNSMRVMENPDLAPHTKVLTVDETNKLFAWLENTFPIRNGQINWRKFPDAIAHHVDPLSNQEISELLKEIDLAGNTDVYAIWASSQCGVRISASLAFEHVPSFWLPVADDLWFITPDFRVCIELYYEGSLTAIGL